ncbi:hypothetical protein DFS34DRAFT_605234 [Phlyctochytrium arcticum]|nr:hypothetical protein DFS34DRAFT_605234 [Phlyctochytrium arcticum]
MNSSKTHITENRTVSNGITRVGNDIRGNYQGGSNIQISGNTISCTYEYEAPEESPYIGGNFISVSGRSINNTMTLVGGTGVIVTPTGTGYSISSIDTQQNKRTAEDVTENQMDVSEPKVYKNGTGSTVASTGGLLGALGPLGGIFNLAGGIAAVPGIASSAIGGVAQLAGALTGGSLVGGYISVYGHERKQEKDQEGNGLCNVDNTPKLEPGSNIVIYTAPDAVNCPDSRLMFDKPSCSWIGVQNEYEEQAVNLEILREYDSEVIQPNTVSLLSQLISPINDRIDTVEAVIQSVKTDLGSNYQVKITNGNKLSYSLISDTPNFSGFATTSNVAANYVSNSLLNTTLLGYVSNTSLATVLATKQPLITSSSKLEYSLVANTPDFAPYLTRTTDLNSINASIATKVSQSAYDIRQTTLDLTIATKQNTINNILSLSGVDSNTTTLLTDNFTIAPMGVLTGRYFTLNASLYYGSLNDDGIQIMCGEGTSPTIVPPLSLPRVTLTNSSPLTDNVLLTKDSNATEIFKFAPFATKVSSQLTIQDDYNYVVFSSPVTN